MLHAEYADQLALSTTRVIVDLAAPEDPETAAARLAARQEAQAQLKAWLASDVRARFIELFGEIPEVFSAKHAEQRQLLLYPDWWRCLLYEELIHCKRGCYITYKDCFEVLDRHQVGQGMTRAPRCTGS